MLCVHERGERRVRRVVPLAGRRFAARVLRGGDDLEVLVFQLVVKCLPTWQIESAPSPGGPGDHQHLLAAEAPTRWTGRPVRSGTAKSGATRESRNAPLTSGISPKLHTRAAVSATTACPTSRERREIEVRAAGHCLRNRNADVGAASALRFHFELVDARQVGLAHPQRILLRARRSVRHAAAGTTRSSYNTVVGRAARRCCGAVSEAGVTDTAPTQPKKIASFHTSPVPVATLPAERVPIIRSAARKGAHLARWPASDRCQRRVSPLCAKPTVSISVKMSENKTVSAVDTPVMASGQTFGWTWPRKPGSDMRQS